MKSQKALLLSLLITLFIFLNIYFFASNESQRREVTISRVIDGDTFEIENADVRLVNMNTPEKNEPGYDEAKNFLLQFENKTVEIEELSTDRYGRTLARVFYSGKYLNLELVQLGLAKKFLVQESELKEFDEAENEAVENSLGLWKKSDLFGCFDSSIDAENEIIILSNQCENAVLKDFTISDESRKKYKFSEPITGEVAIHSGIGKNNKTDLFFNTEQSVWNNDRDTLYLFDSQDRIVLHKSYGY